MNTTLRDRLDNLAAAETAGLMLTDPRFPAAGKTATRRPQPLRLAIAASTILILGFGAMWLAGQSGERAEVATGGPVKSQPIPSLLLEDPLPFDALPPELADMFEIRGGGPQRLFDPDFDGYQFSGVHLIEFDEVTVGVGLDDSGEILCIGETVSGARIGGSACSTMAGFMLTQAAYQTITLDDSNTTAVFVADEVTGVEFPGGADLLVPVTETERNVAFFSGPVRGPIALLLADGRRIPIGSDAQGDTDGEIHTDGSTLLLQNAGCALVDDRLTIEANFSDRTEGFVAMTLVDAGLHLIGGIGDASINVTDGDAQVSRSVDAGRLRVDIRWDTSESSGSLWVDCGNRLLDLSAIR